MNENCPCDAVKSLQRAVENHEKQLAEGNTGFAVIKKDLEYIKEKIDSRSRFNATTFSAVIQAVMSLIVLIIAAKLGLSGV